MAARISVSEAQAWTESSKLTLGSLDAALESQISARVLGSLNGVFDVSGWLDSVSTPQLVRSVISMLYVAELYDRTYSNDLGTSTYGAELRKMANDLLDGIESGDFDLVEVAALPITGPKFYPTDTSSSSRQYGNMPPVYDGTGYGYADTPPAFTMGRIF